MKIEWLPKAEITRDDQLAYIAQYSVQAARKVAVQIERQIVQLTQFPELGRMGRQCGTRELVISHTPLVVVYRLRSKLARIEIIRVLHASQQWPIGILNEPSLIYSASQAPSNVAWRFPPGLCVCVA